MAERTTVTQGVQIGVEATPGTSVAANRKLQSMTFSPFVKSDGDSFRPSGFKFPTMHAIGKEWAGAKLTGNPTYSELIYPMSSVLAYAAPAQQGATTAYKWSHSPSTTSEDTVKTYTIERGSAVRADKSTYGLVSGFSLSGDRSKLDLGGEVLMRATTDGITLTSSPTSIELIPILPKDVSIYLDTTSAALGTTKLTRALSWAVDIKPRYNPLWVVDQAQTSYVTHVETPVDGQVKLKLEADAVGMGLLTAMRDNTTRFMRIEALSSQLAGVGFPYRLGIDLALQIVGEPSEITDEDGVCAIEWTFDITHDATWGKSMLVELTNKQTTL